MREPGLVGCTYWRTRRMRRNQHYHDRVNRVLDYNAMGASASAISSPNRSSPSTASATLPMWVAPGSICTGSGFLRVPSSRRTCRPWRYSYDFRRK